MSISSGNGSIIFFKPITAFIFSLLAENSQTDSISIDNNDMHN